MDVFSQKIQFAQHLHREPQNPFGAGQSVFPNDIGSACKCALEWPKDQTVLDEIERLNAEVPDEQIPTKVNAALVAWELANNRFIEAKDRILALRLFSEIANYMPDKTVNKNLKVDDNACKNVMLVPIRGDNEDWEKELLEQQARLTNEV